MSVKDFRRFIVSVAQQMSHQESEMLRWMYELPVQFKGTPPLTVLQRMESQGLFSADKPEKLADVLKDINRMDLAKKAKDYAKGSKRGKKLYQDGDTVQREDQLVTLTANFEVALIQMKIMLEQLERVRQGVVEAQQKRVEEIISCAREDAERTQRKLQQASILSQAAYKRDVESDCSPSPTPVSSAERTQRRSTMSAYQAVKEFAEMEGRSSPASSEEEIHPSKPELNKGTICPSRKPQPPVTAPKPHIQRTQNVHVAATIPLELYEQPTNLHHRYMNRPNDPKQTSLHMSSKFYINYEPKYTITLHTIYDYTYMSVHVCNCFVGIQQKDTVDSPSSNQTGQDGQRIRRRASLQRKCTITVPLIP